MARATPGDAGAARQRTAQILGVRTPILESGRPDAEEAVVFLHGQPGSSRDWEPLLLATGEFARAVAFDLPGFGRAEKPRDWSYSISSYAVFTAAALNQLGVRRAHLVMHDVGGGAGLLWAASHPEAFASAVITGTGVLPGFRWHWLARAMRAPVLGPLTARATNGIAFRRTLRLTHPQLPGPFIDRLWDDYTYESRRAAMSMYRSAPSDGFARLAPLFRDLDRPALVIWGKYDPFISVRHAERQRDSFPSADVAVLEAGHWPWIERPDEAAEHILPFLRRHAAGSG